MFGYHDSPYCSTDIWAPKSETWGYNAIENRAFSPYAKHTQEVEDIINMIGNGYTGGIECDDDMSAGDMRYIEQEVYKRYGISVNLT